MHPFFWQGPHLFLPIDPWGKDREISYPVFFSSISDFSRFVGVLLEFSSRRFRFLLSSSRICYVDPDWLIRRLQSLSPPMNDDLTRYRELFFSLFGIIGIDLFGGKIYMRRFCSFCESFFYYLFLND